MTKAEETCPKDNFHIKYPTKEYSQSGSRLREGHFECQPSYADAPFKPNNSILMDSIGKDYIDSWLFFLTDKDF